MLSKKIKVLDRKINFRNEHYSFSSKVMQNIYKLIKKYNNKGLEIGGYLFAEEKLKNSFHNIINSQPSKKDIFKPDSYFLDLKNEQKNINKYTRKGLKYSSLWHSHRDHNTKPSLVDDKNVRDLLKDLNKEQIISLIFNTKEVRIIFYWLRSKKLKKEWIILKLGDVPWLTMN